MSAAPDALVDRALRWLLFAAVAALLPLSMLVVDSGRDLGWAYAIAGGDAFPLYGPQLNNLWRLGPVWFYVLALPLALTRSIALTALAVGLLAAAKIPLAYAIGARWRGPALGLTYAAAVALPGWNSFGQLVLSHASVVETAVLATLWAAWSAWQRQHAGSALASSLLLALAVHAHPTALVAAPAVALALARTARTRLWLWPLAAALFLLPFAPMLWAEARAGWPQWGATAGYFGAADYGARLARAPAVLWGASAGGVAFVREFLLGRWPVLAAAVGVGMLLCYAVAPFGLWRTARREVRAACALGLATLAWLFVLLLRDATPVWMSFACAPFGAALLALGWLGLWPETQQRAAARAFAAFALLASGAVLADRALTARDGVLSLPIAAIGDLGARVAPDAALRFWLPAYAHDALARRFCASDRALALHGDLATSFHFGQGVATALHCDAASTLMLGGIAPRQLAGVPRILAGQLGLSGEASAGGYVLIDSVLPLHPAQGERVVPHTRYRMDDYLPRLTAQAAPQTLTLETACGIDQVLVVTNLLPLINAPFDVRGLPPPAAQTLASRYYRCGREGRFAFELSTLEPRMADVFVLGKK